MHASWLGGWAETLRQLLLLLLLDLFCLFLPGIGRELPMRRDLHSEIELESNQIPNS